MLSKCYRNKRLLPFVFSGAKIIHFCDLVYILYKVKPKTDISFYQCLNLGEWPGYSLYPRKKAWDAATIPIAKKINSTNPSFNTQIFYWSGLYLKKTVSPNYWNLQLRFYLWYKMIFKVHLLVSCKVFFNLVRKPITSMVSMPNSLFLFLQGLFLPCRYLKNKQ